MCPVGHELWPGIVVITPGELIKLGPTPNTWLGVRKIPQMEKQTSFNLSSRIYKQIDCLAN